jgi:hypothetical protein
LAPERQMSSGRRRPSDPEPQTAVHSQSLAGDEKGVVGGQKQGEPGPVDQA